jgi:FixJ family two-component response regulator
MIQEGKDKESARQRDVIETERGGAGSVSFLCLIAPCQVHLLPRPALIAIVDDDKLVGRSLARLMKSVGFKVEAFASAEDFLQRGNLHNTACLILDVKLPGMSGLDLQRQLAPHHHLPIIFVSAHDNQGTQDQALQAGAVAFLRKPFSKEALLNGIHSALKRLK